MTITFHGAAETVTGSKHLIKLEDGRTILLDCGLFQGHGIEADQLNRNWGFEPSTIDFVILSHAHIDHAGLLPKLIKDGYKGKIYCTPATFDLCKIMLEDSGHIQEYDIAYINKKRKRQNKPLLEPIYSIDDVYLALSKFRTVPYEKSFKIDKNIDLLFTDTGHILGSAAIHLNIQDLSNTYRITFTGDIGRYNNKILKSPQPFPQADYIITESTYGDLLHSDLGLTEEKLLNVVTETCINKKGKLIIPAFSVGRTQEIVNMLNNLHFERQLPSVKIFVDSPLSTNATEVYGNHKECFNKAVVEYMEKDPTPFGFNTLHYITIVEESKNLNLLKEPCIIISASGMADAGRVKHHIANNIDNANNTILIVGWCSPGSLGRKLLDGEKRVSIFGEEHIVKAHIEVMNEFSAHGDYMEMSRYLSCQDPNKVKQIFLVHGEKDVLENWKQRLNSKGFKTTYIPKLHETVKL